MVVEEESIRRVVALLGMLPVTDFDAGAAGALFGTEAGGTARILDTLTAAQLLHEARVGRYAPHDLLRLLATELAAELPTEVTVAAADRVGAWYLATAQRASRLIKPGDEVNVPRDPDPAAPAGRHRGRPGVRSGGV